MSRAIYGRRLFLATGPALASKRCLNHILLFMAEFATMPVRNTNGMPVSIAGFGVGLWPANDGRGVPAHSTRPNE